MKTKSDEEILDELKRRFERNQKTYKEQERLVKELQLVNNKLVESEKLKSQFLSNIRNEINNPLTSILGLAQTITKGQHNEIDLKRISQLIHQEAFILDFQLRNIFIAAELESGLLSPEPSRLDIEQLINQVVKEFNHLIQKKEIVLHVKLDLQDDDFYSDAEKIHLILINLLSNAIEFSHLGGALNLSISNYQGQFTVVIQDFGLGIRTEDQEIIFDRFKQLDAGTTKTHQGHGLGLSVTHELIDMLGGIIHVESEINQGCKFTIRFPALEALEYSDSTFGGSEFLFETGDELF